MSSIHELMQQLDAASAEVARRQLQVQLHREYLACLEVMGGSAGIQRNELAMLEGEVDRWETLVHRISELVASHKLAEYRQRMAVNDFQAPRYMTMRLSDGSGYFVLVTWPDDFETQVHGFAHEDEANAWIGKNGPKWREWAPHRVPRRHSNQSK